MDDGMTPVGREALRRRHDGHGHVGGWCPKCVEHGRELAGRELAAVIDTERCSACGGGVSHALPESLGDADRVSSSVDVPAPKEPT